MERKIQLRKINLVLKKDHEEEGSQPVSPLGQYLSSSVLSSCVLGVLELEVPIDDSQTIPLLENVFLPINPRFSCIMVSNEDGVKQWKRVKVNLNDHVKVPVLPSGMSSEFYDNCFDDYLTKITMEQLPQSNPLWEIHIIKYPTSNAAGNIIFKLHHSLGDGYSLMGALLSCLQRADHPSLPLTFPSVKLRQNINDSSNILRRVPSFFSSAFNMVSDFCWTILKSSLIEDDLSPIRSGDADFKPVAIETMTFSLHHIKQIKASLGVTVNDVITGIIFFGSRLYMEEMSEGSSNAHSTFLVLLNTRMFRDYKSIKEMVKPDAESPWGNHFAFLNISIPNVDADAEFSNPLEFIKKSHQIISRKRSSLSVFLVAWFLEAVKKIRGPEAASKFLYGTLKNTSMCITNVIGPMEQMALANHPVKGLYFMVTGFPTSVMITIVSYMGELRVAVGAEKGFIDDQKFKSCIEKAFEMMLKAACEK